ncbi:MAG: hypothetical protein LBE35_02220 [Clostridiales bacterium]|jgi:DNA mismatch repair ATPase MutS|nr:hypothetical protein [Clostridiales bacterium]
MSKDLNKTLRIATILLAQGVLIFGFFQGHSIWTVAAFIGFLAAFFVLNHFNTKMVKQQKIAQARAILQGRNADRKSGEWVKFEQDGAEYVDANHPYSRDLDLFGEASLFQYLNETNTEYGKEILKVLFLTEKRDEAAVLRRQAAIKEISENSAFCEGLKIKGLMSENISLSPAAMVEFFESEDKLFASATLRFAVRILPFITALLVASNFIVGLNNALLIFSGLAMVLQVMVFATLANKTEAILKEIGKFRGSLDDFGEMAAIIREADFKAELNKTWQEKLPAKWNLKRISLALRARNITLLDLLLNIVALWDIHCVCVLEDLRAKGAKDMRVRLETIGYFEAMASVAVLPQQNPDWVYPEICAELALTAKNLGHPLIEEFDRVANDFDLKGIGIISGSNMSGKTTFLRTVGINLVLAYMGAPVCAAAFKAPAVAIWTCMRPPDNLKQNISTFYAELLRIKNIIDNENPMLFLIDEIFAGTNSEDRVTGAKAVLQNLHKKQNLGLITTHDLEVCKTESFANHHFSEHYVDNEIRFDFKIKPGISTTRNAKFLMKMIGIDIKE